MGSSKHSSVKYWPPAVNTPSYLWLQTGALKQAVSTCQDLIFFYMFYSLNSGFVNKSKEEGVDESTVKKKYIKQNGK